ncbi:MAG: N-acetylmuramoyl-L-alanine amidase [Lachnospiraceae bacterium]|nr:N-acetylmuramoyl-L-alanine amidase [Lachnospiraceae bacterium]
MTRSISRGEKSRKPGFVIFGLLLLTGVFLAAGSSKVCAAPSVTVVIDPGHGGKSDEKDETNSGAKYHGLEEKNVNLITAIAMYDELAEYGNVNVYITRDIDAPLTIERRADFAKEVGADVLISIHYNASENHNFFGSEIFTSAYGKCYGTGHALAEKIMDEWVADGNIRKDIKTRIGKKGDYYGLIRRGTENGVPTIILEHGYLDNDRDYQRIKNDMAWKRFGIMDATAVAKYFGLEKNVVKESIGPVDEPEDPADPVRPDSTHPTGVRLEMDNYSSNKGNVDFTLYAYDDESKLMYYGFKTGDVDEDTVFEELELWDGKNGKLSGTYHLQPGYEGKLTAIVYNVYQLETLSNTVELEANEEEPDDEADNAVIDDGSADEDDRMFTDDFEPEAKEDDWIIGGALPTVDTSAVANAIDKNTESKVKSSYTGLVIALLVAGMAVAVAIVLSISIASQKRRERKRGQKRENRDVFDWAEEYDKD